MCSKFRAISAELSCIVDTKADLEGGRSNRPSGLYITGLKSASFHLEEICKKIR